MRRSDVNPLTVGERLFVVRNVTREGEETRGNEDREREKQKRVKRDDRGWPSRTTCPTLCLSSVKRDTFSVSRGGCKTIVRHVEARTHPSLALTHMTAPRRIPNSSSIVGFIPQRNRPDRDHPDLGHLPRSQPPDSSFSALVQRENFARGVSNTPLMSTMCRNETGMARTNFLRVSWPRMDRK